MPAPQRLTWVGHAFLPAVQTHIESRMGRIAAGVAAAHGAGHRYDFNDRLLAIGAGFWVRLAESQLPPPG